MRNKIDDIKTWKDFDRLILTPNNEYGEPPSAFGPNAKVFSYMALRSMAILAFEAGANSVKAD